LNGYLHNAEIGGDALATAVETEASGTALGITILQIEISFLATVAGVAFHIQLEQFTGGKKR